MDIIKSKAKPWRQETDLDVCKAKNNWKGGRVLGWPGVLRSTEKIFDAT